jgi:hypothetical protein
MPLRMLYNITALQTNSVKSTVMLLLYTTALGSSIIQMGLEMKLLKKIIFYKNFLF